jgi:hypothetical protein
MESDVAAATKDVAHLSGAEAMLARWKELFFEGLA